MIRSFLARLAPRAAALAATFTLAGAAWAAAAPSALPPQPFDEMFGAATSMPTRCTPPAADAADRLPGDGTAAAPADGAQRLALGGTHCWWACYPGSGCEYICRFYPQ